MTDGFVFSGQGSQYVGMGVGLCADHPVARATFEEANDVLGEDLTSLLREGPIEKLTLTENAQPAILTLSVALLRVLSEERPHVRPVVAAGHSLGEYSALVAAEVLEFSDAVRLVRLRGQAMQSAVPAGVGAMAAVVGLDAAKISDLCLEQAEGEVVQVAGHNSPIQVVIAGNQGAVQRVMKEAEEAGARRCSLLQVSAPFHCKLLEPAGEELAAAMERVTFHAPRFPVIQNATAASHQDPADIRQALVDQVSQPVRWVECVQAMRAEGVERFLELGPGRTLCGLIKKMDRSWKTIALDQTGALDGVA